MMVAMVIVFGGRLFVYVIAGFRKGTVGDDGCLSGGGSMVVAMANWVPFNSILSYFNIIRTLLCPKTPYSWFVLRAAMVMIGVIPNFSSYFYFIQGEDKQTIVWRKEFLHMSHIASHWSRFPLVQSLHIDESVFNIKN